MKFFQSTTHSGERGFTLVEAIVGLMMLVLAASVIFFAFSQTNHIASEARLYTAAQFIVQQQIDLIQSDTPFIPQNSQIPPELSGTAPATYPTVYADPATGNTLVTGTLATTITNISNSGYLEYAYRAQVQLTYSYRSKQYEVDSWTIRGSDQ